MSLRLKRAEMRGAVIVLAALALALACQAGAADPGWRSYTATTPGFDVDYYRSGHVWTFTFKPGFGMTGYTEFSEFVLYPQNIGSSNPLSHPYEYAWNYDQPEPPAGYRNLPNAANRWEPWGTTPANMTTHYNVGFELKSQMGKYNGAFGWQADPAGQSQQGGWMTTSQVQFRAWLPDVANGWGWDTGNVYFQVTARRQISPGTYESKLFKAGSVYHIPEPVIPEPATLALLATGGVGLLPLLRRRRAA